MGTSERSALLFLTLLGWLSIFLSLSPYPWQWFINFFSVSKEQSFGSVDSFYFICFLIHYYLYYFIFNFSLVYFSFLSLPWMDTKIIEFLAFFYNFCIKVIIYLASLAFIKASCSFWYVMVYWSFSVKYLKNFIVIFSLKHWLFVRIFITFLTYGDFPIVYLLLSFSLILPNYI